MWQRDLLILYPRKTSQFGLRQRQKNHAVPDMETVAGDICAAVNFIEKNNNGNNNNNTDCFFLKGQLSSKES